MSHARFAVICPAFNRSSRIVPTIESVLSQEHTDLVMLVGSDGSSDDTDDVVAEMARNDNRLRLRRFDHTGDPGTIRNLLCREVQSEYVAYLDHDDLWDPAHLELLGAALDRGEDVVASGGLYRQEDRLVRAVLGQDLLWHPNLSIVDPYCEPSRVAHRASILDVVGGWAAAGAGLEDWDLWWRFTEHGFSFQPVDAATAEVAMSPGSRRNRLRYRMVMPLAESGEVAAATAAAEDMATVMAEGITSDLERWSSEVVEDPQTRFALEVCSTREKPPFLLDAKTRQNAHGDGQPGTALTVCVFPGGRKGWLVGVAAPYVNRNHGRRIAEVLTSRFGTTLKTLTASLQERLAAAAEPVGINN